ncbi:hypothetical protein HOO54_23065 [Bacillus sp. WMMC1349]|uniref:hypothetical protein n=1 Tax=Bacillus sp. WMMC1349 TaxID=2736254 RepID=UPI0015547785|nr:hypothetical protein [Bacillus sp. WMMC1349]NPC90976.1 hypothetical protein [Bacillus sp. WMMC1349]NPC91074.1 hypothetical protein [Bacillus sp. WMMC1349]NPC95013.1 hypothetical protein [Bacillus sp. WMMC1349]
MNNNVDYESIKDSVVFSFEEYVEDDGFTAPQSAAKVFEEDWRELNYNIFTKTAYYICVAIECFKLKEIPDFIYEKLDYYIKSNEFKVEANTEDIDQLLQDINKCKQLMGSKDYKVIESSFGAKSRIEYILSLKP